LEIRAIYVWVMVVTLTVFVFAPILWGVFPVFASETFGNTHAGVSTQTIGWFDKSASQFTAPEDGIITDMTVYQRHDEAGQKVTAAVYSDSGSDTPDALLGYVTRTDVAGDNVWRWSSFTGFNIEITEGTKYWLCLHHDATYGMVGYDSETCNNRKGTGDSHPPSDPFGSGTDSDTIKLSIYATYTPDLGDSIAPSYSGLSVSTTLAGNSSTFNCTMDDDVALESDGQFVFGTNNTGSWVWDGALNFSSTPQTVSVEETLNSSVGVYVAYMWNFSDHAQNINSTGLQGFLTTVEYEEDTTAPSYSGLSVSTTLAGNSSIFYCSMNDDVALESDGQYEFGTNNTGSWVWEDALNFSSTPQTVSVEKTLNSSVGVYVGYIWNFSDHAQNINSTGLKGFLTTVSYSPEGGGVSREDVIGICVIGVCGLLIVYKKGFLNFLF